MLSRKRQRTNTEIFSCHWYAISPNYDDLAKQFSMRIENSSKNELMPVQQLVRKINLTKPTTNKLHRVTSNNL